jgi:hypothetical protein
MIVRYSSFDRTTGFNQLSESLVRDVNPSPLRVSARRGSKGPHFSLSIPITCQRACPRFTRKPTMLADRLPVVNPSATPQIHVVVGLPYRRFAARGRST